MPKVSVIIPAFNVAKYVSAALDSVFAQTFRDFEIIVINDGSTDNTLKILCSYKPLIKLFTKPNGGPASARNVGIKNSTAEYVAFLDADDLWLKHKLELQVNYLNARSDVGFIYGDTINFSVGKFREEKIETIRRCDIEGFIFKQLFWSNFIPNSTVMVRRRCFDKVGLFDESKNLIGSEDYELWLRLSRIFKLGHIPTILAKRRLHKENLLGHSYNKAFVIHKDIYHKFFSSYQGLEKELGMSANHCLGDLCLRYSYKNFVDGQRLFALKKSFLAARYAPLKATIASLLILRGVLDSKIWSRIIAQFKLWQEIVSHN